MPPTKKYRDPIWEDINILTDEETGNYRCRDKPSLLAGNILFRILATSQFSAAL